MRRIIALFCALAIILNITPFSYARDSESDVIRIFVDGDEIETGKPPIIENGRTLVPIRAVAERAGITVGWDGDKREASLYCDFVTATLTVDSDEMKVYSSIIDEERTVKLDAIPKIIDGSTYITLRAALEAVGAKVFWDGDMRIIYVVSSEKSRELRYAGTTPEKYVEKIKLGMGGGEDSEDKPSETPDEQPKDEPVDTPDEQPKDEPVETPDEQPKDEPVETPDEQPKDEPVETPDEQPKDEPVETPDEQPKDEPVETPDEQPKDEPSDSPEEDYEPDVINFKGFREMSGDSIKENEQHTIYGKITAEKPLVSVRCAIADSDIGHTVELSADEKVTSYSLFSDFGRRLRFNGAGVGDKVFEIYATVEGGREQLIFTYNYTVTAVEKKAEPPKVSDEDDEEIIDGLPDRNGKDDGEDDEDGEAVLSYSGFRRMTNDRIVEGAPHGLYGTVLSSKPLVSVRCCIEETDMDYSVRLSARNEITSYNVFSYFDKLIRFSDAGLGEQTFSVYAKAEGEREKLLFNYDYTVVKKTEDSNPEKDTGREKVDYTNPDYPDDVCLPLEGEIRLTSPYGFRAYNKWEFHKGIDIVSESLNILSVADGVVVDCATGRNSGAGNYVIIQHDGGWVSLYYHLKSYSVEVGDKVKMGERIAIMGNSGGNYGVHLHFMTCDNWYGGIWATQNNHHTAPHEYVPQVLTEVKNYNPNFEEVNKDKVILCSFNFPNAIEEGTAFSVSGVKGFAASEDNLSSLAISVSDKDGKVIILESEEEPKSTTDGYYIYTNISVALDMKCHFDKLPVGEYIFRVHAVTSKGRERVIYTKAFEVVEKSEKSERSEVLEAEVGSSKDEVDSAKDEVDSAKDEGSDEGSEE